MKSVTIVDNRATAAKHRSKREKMGVGLRELARVMGVSGSYLCNLELGKRKWSTSICERYSRGLKELEDQ